MSILTEGKLEEELEGFLKGFTDKAGRLKYREEALKAVLSRKTSIVVDFEDLLTYDRDIADLLLSEPDLVQRPFDRAAYRLFSVVNPQLTAELPPGRFKVRIKNLPDRIPLRAVSSANLDRLIAVAGMVVRTSEVKPLLVEAAWRCPRGHITREPQRAFSLKLPRRCSECEETRQFELDKRASFFTDYQIARLQELPEELPPGQLPQSLDVYLTGDIVNSARPGDRVVVVGINRAEPESAQGRPLSIFKSRLEGVYVEVLGKEEERLEITEEDEARFKKLVQQPDAFQRLVASVAPAVHGYTLIKEALLLQVVSAPQRILSDGTTLRGDINILLVGDPGTAKSELLKYMARLAPRGLYTTGRGSTAAGLTAAVVKEKGGMMMLEAGALVLADQGLACIDEFDKMRPEDRQVLHEVMEQNSVSVAKGGIVATLNARTSIVAAANPVFGKYDPYRNIYENVAIPVPLLTRFDLIFVIRDVPERSRDEEVARHVIELHRRRDFPVEPPLDFEFLRKFVAYAKRMEPELTKEAEQRILDYYVKLRSMGSEALITITPRQLESLIRLSTARARLLLKPKVTLEDVDEAIRLFDYMLQSVAMDVKTGRVDLGVLHGRPLSLRTVLTTGLDIFKRLEGERREPVDARVFIEELMKATGISREEAERALANMVKSGMVFEAAPGKYRRI